jgi:hypothetical protein
MAIENRRTYPTEAPLCRACFKQLLSASNWSRIPGLKLEALKGLHEKLKSLNASGAGKRKSKINV